eukprot:1136280-Pelagomonas_calceolata.AAC.1
MDIQHVLILEGWIACKYPSNDLRFDHADGLACEHPQGQLNQAMCENEELMPRCKLSRFWSSLILWSERKGGANFGPEHLEHGHLCAPARQKWCEQGNQASTVFGHNLSIRTCSECFLGVPAEFGGPGVQGVAPGKQ